MSWCRKYSNIEINIYWKSINCKLNIITYNNQSTAITKVTSSAGSPMVSNTITIVIRPAWGIAAAPIDAAVAVKL